MREDVLYNGLTVACAGAGTGKTTYLINQYIEKIEYLQKRGLSPKEAIKTVLAVTFSKKATGEMIERVKERIGVGEIAPYLQIYTIDAFCARVLRSFPQYSGIDSSFEILSEGNEKIIFGNLIKTLKENLPLKTISPRDMGKEKQLYNFITNLRYDLIAPEDLKKLKMEEVSGFLSYVLTVYEMYSRELRKKAMMDFPQLLFETYKLLENEIVCGKLRDEYAFVFIDEFQDTSKIQLEIFKKIKPKFLCVVGDYNQSIYSFRGAEPGNISKVADEAQNLKILAENYRSSSRILSFVNTLSPKLVGYENLRPHQGAGVGEKVKIVLARDRVSEAAYIAEKICRIKSAENLKYSDFAVILRSFKSAVSDYESVFRSAEIPFLTSSGSGFYARPEIRQIFALVRAVARPADDGAFLGFLMSPLFSFSPGEIYDFAKERGRSESLYEAFLKTRKKTKKMKNVITLFERVFSLSHSSLYRFMHNLIIVSGVINWVQGNFSGVYLDRAIANIKKFLEVVLKYENFSDMPTLDGFAEYVSDIKEQGAVESEGTVEHSDCTEIMTVHAIKGLEKKVVFVANIRPGQFPGKNKPSTPWFVSGCKLVRCENSKGKKEIPDEEWRLFYVALTRAKEKLFLLGSPSRGKISKMLEYFIEDNEGAYSLKKEFADIAEFESAAAESDAGRFVPGSLIPEVKYSEPVNFFSEERLVKEKLEEGLTVTEVALYESCPRRFEAERILNVPTSRSTSAIKIGNIFHQSIEYFNSLGEEEFCRRIRGALKSENGGAGKTERLLSNFLKSRFTKPPYLAEEPFVLNVGGVFIKGAIDRIDKVNGGYALCDYKTGKFSENYILQMNIYALGAAEVLKLSPVKALTLFFITTGEEKEVEIVRKEKMYMKLHKITAGIKKMKFECRRNESCVFCPSRDVCG